MSNLYPTHTPPYWEKIECPTCGAKIGHHCLTKPGVFNRCCKERFIIAIRLGLKREGKLYLPPRTPKPKKENNGGQGRVKHEDGWIAGNCVSNHHSTCFSMKCACECHKREQGI